MLGRVILYLACRHHIMELIAKKPFYAVVGYDPSPDILMFKRLKEIWNSIDKTGPFLTFDLGTEQRDKLIMTNTEILTKEDVDGQIFVRPHNGRWSAARERDLQVSPARSLSQSSVPHVRMMSG